MDKKQTWNENGKRENPYDCKNVFEFTFCKSCTPFHRFNDAAEIILCILFAIIFIANIAGNVFVCAIVLKTKQLQNFTNILVVNMAVGDVIVGVIGVMHIILEVLVLISLGNEFTLLCGVLNGIVLFSASISIYTMAVLAYDRYLSVVKPVSYTHLTLPTNREV